MTFPIAVYLISFLLAFIILIVASRYINTYHHITTAGDVILSFVFALIPLVNILIVVFFVMYSIGHMVEKAVKYISTKFNKKLF